MASSVSEVEVPRLEELLQLVREHDLTLAECLALERVLDDLAPSAGSPNAGGDVPFQLASAEE